jgi:hypothetical protein
MNDQETEKSALCSKSGSKEEEKIFLRMSIIVNAIQKTMFLSVALV